MANVLYKICNGENPSTYATTKSNNQGESQTFTYVSKFDSLCVQSSQHQVRPGQACVNALSGTPSNGIARNLKNGVLWKIIFG